MSFFQKKENIILTSVVAGFFLILAVWYDVGGIRGLLLKGEGGKATNPYELFFIDENNEPKTLADFKGKPLVVNFWATWCPVCVDKMDTLNDLSEKMKAQGGEVIAISNDQAGIGKVKAFYIKNHYNNLSIYVDTRGHVLHAFGGQGLPTTILINAEGKMVGKITGGFDWTSSRAYDMIQDKLGLDLHN